VRNMGFIPDIFGHCSLFFWLCSVFDRLLPGFLILHAWYHSVLFPAIEIKMYVLTVSASSSHSVVYVSFHEKALIVNTYRKVEVKR
jgi:hypothetical protein